jgi:lipopolysaccharide assembly protein A
MVLIYIVMAIVGAAAAIFAYQNTSPVVIEFLGWRKEGPLFLVIMLSILVGVIFTALVGVVRRWKLRSKIRQLESRISQLQASNPQRIDSAPR